MGTILATFLFPKIYFKIKSFFKNIAVYLSEVEVPLDTAV